jgi:hypothetical protein
MNPNIHNQRTTLNKTPATIVMKRMVSSWSDKSRMHRLSGIKKKLRKLSWKKESSTISCKLKKR